MTNGYVTADPAAWASALEDLRNATETQRDPLSASEACLASDRFVDAQERVLDLNAPDILGVIKKLDIIWEADLRQENQEAEWKMGVLGDLWRLHGSQN